MRSSTDNVKLLLFTKSAEKKYPIIISPEGSGSLVKKFVYYQEAGSTKTNLNTEIGVNVLINAGGCDKYNFFYDYWAGTGAPLKQKFLC